MYGRVYGKIKLVSYRSTSWIQIRRFSKSIAIVDRPELRTIQAVEQLFVQLQTKEWKIDKPAKVEYNTWLDTYKLAKQNDYIEKKEFEDLIDNVVQFLQSKETEVWQLVPKISAVPLDHAGETKNDQSNAMIVDKVEYLESYLEGIRLSLTREKCKYLGTFFQQLDKHGDGKIAMKHMEDLLLKLIYGNQEELLACYFEIFAKSSAKLKEDNPSMHQIPAVNAQECMALQECILSIQKNAMKHIFIHYVANLPSKIKVLEKSLDNSVSETMWNEKVTEKMRCVFAYANRNELELPVKVVTKSLFSPRTNDEKELPIPFKCFQTTQEKEFPELLNAMPMFARGFHDERRLHYVRLEEKKDTRIKGLVLALLIAIGDYIADII